MHIGTRALSLALEELLHRKNHTPHLVRWQCLRGKGVAAKQTPREVTHLSGEAHRPLAWLGIVGNSKLTMRRIWHKDDGGKGTLGLVVQALPLTVVVDARPGDSGPSIIELPVEAPHTVGGSSTLGTYPEGDPTPLHHLREVDEVCEVPWLGIVLTDVVEDDIVADTALLMRLHYLTLQSVVGLGTSKAADAREHREGLHPKLTHEARHALTQDFEGFTPVPYAPVVAFTEPQLLGSSPVHRVGTAFDIGAQGVFLAQGLRDEACKEGFVVVPEAFVHLLGVALCPAPVLESFAYLIVAAPRRQRGMLAQTADVVHQFALHVFQEGTIPRVGGAGEHKVLPDEDTARIGFVIEVIFLVRSPTPHTEHIEVRTGDVIKELLAVGLGARRQEECPWDVVRPLGEERLPIDTEEEAPPILIWLTYQLNGAQPDGTLRLI